MGLPDIIAIAVSLGVGVWVILTYNRFVTLRNRCVNAFSQIDIQIEKRHELVPELVDTVRGYTAHESETLEMVTQARSEALGAGTYRKRASAEENLGSSVKSLFAVSERYPELKADSVYLQLHRDLTRLEEDIRFARQFYNDTVMIHNTTIGTFPNNIVARLTGAGDMEYFGLPD